MSTDFLKRAIVQGAGRGEADLVLKNGRFLDLVTGELVSSDIALCEDRIVGTFGEYRGRREIDIAGKVVVPGFIDTHFHVESSLMPPLEFERCVLPHGVTTGICDPHEMANVLGPQAFAWFIESAEATAMDLRIQLSSCVPAAAHLETSGACIEAADLMPFAGHRKVMGLAEFMNFPGVLAGDAGVLAKLAAFQGRPIDGHAPLLRGAPLNGYIAAGIRTEHEATTPDEAMEKLSKGMTVLIREGSVSKDLHSLAPILTERTAPFLAFCTDDRNPLDIAEEGHLDFVVRTAIRLGCPPLAVYRAASWSAARAFGLLDRGLVAPGQRADLVILDDFLTCAVSSVISGGRTVDDALFAGRATVAPIGRGSIRNRHVTASDFAAPGSGPSTPVIGVVPGKIITLRHDLSLPYRNGQRHVDLGQDAVKVAVVERHGRTPLGERGIGVAFVKGFGLKRGAIASSVGHDCHNITVVGADEADMAVAVNRLAEIEGGFVVAAGGHVLAEISLPVAGLMSLQPHAEIAAALRRLREAARGLGVVLPEPFLQVAFLPLPVIPHLKITDRGLVDVDRFELIDP
ncbi:adenine deaminase [Methylobacterium persicinum]|uniref:Adenine deaminase n=1 Tax=Methylobacterium persicinum TaxID=374426 RepID=A0ABU0HIN7_9HYPH|nr:adenine deaminase [Methylobacterium persicinum]MDQ0442194.1 adenine deaminase [Methylobacterium persicinum]GJE40661.1 Adenine deaminase [Methylobacterium persicinum]